MFSLEGEYAFGYTKLAGEVTHDSLETAAGHERATRVVHPGSPDARRPAGSWPVDTKARTRLPESATTTTTTLRVGEVCVGFRLDELHGSRQLRRTEKPTSLRSQTGRSVCPSSGRGGGW